MIEQRPYRGLELIPTLDHFSGKPIDLCEIVIQRAEHLLHHKRSMGHTVGALIDKRILLYGEQKEAYDLFHLLGTLGDLVLHVLEDVPLPQFLFKERQAYLEAPL